MAVAAHVNHKGLSREQYDQVRSTLGWLEVPPVAGLAHLTWWECGDCHNIAGQESEEAFNMLGGKLAAKILAVCSILSISGCTAVDDPRTGQEPTPDPRALWTVIGSGQTTSVDRAVLPLDSAVNMAPVIAEVEVVSVGDARFNTDDGAKPESDPETDPGEHMIYRPVVIKFTNVLKGADIMGEATGAVVSRRGGEIEGFRDAEEPVFPLDTPNEHGMIFLAAYNAADVTGPNASPNLAYLQRYASGISTPENVFRLMGVQEVYAYDGDDAVNGMTGERQPIATLLASIQDVLQGP